MSVNKNNFAKTPLAKQKHAEFMLKMAEKIFSIVLTGLLGAPVLYWFTHTETQGAFVFYVIILGVGTVMGAILLCKAMTFFNQPADCSTTSSNKGEK